MPMSPMVAIKAYIESNGGRKVESRELIDFKKVCTEAEWAEFGAMAAKNMGETIEPKQA